MDVLTILEWYIFQTISLNNFILLSDFRRLTNLTPSICFASIAWNFLFSFFSYFFFFSCKWIMLHQKTNNVIQILEIGRSSTIWSYNVRKFPKLLNYLEENKNFKALAKISLEKKMSNCCNKVQLATCKHLKQARTSMEQKNKTQGCDD